MKMTTVVSTMECESVGVQMSDGEETKRERQCHATNRDSSLSSTVAAVFVGIAAAKLTKSQQKMALWVFFQSLLGRQGAPEVEEAEEGEVQDRLRVIKPVIQNLLEGKNNTGSQKLRRNLALHNPCARSISQLDVATCKQVNRGDGAKRDELCKQESQKQDLKFQQLPAKEASLEAQTEVVLSNVDKGGSCSKSDKVVREGNTTMSVEHVQTHKVTDEEPVVEKAGETELQIHLEIELMKAYTNGTEEKFLAKILKAGVLDEEGIQNLIEVVNNYAGIT